MIIPVTFLLALTTVVSAKSFDWNCEKSLGPCNNACYKVNCKGPAGKLVLTYDSDKSKRRPRRTASGCNRTPCTKTKYKKYGNSCDEFPFASTKEGGAGALLRCVDSKENDSEGGQLSGFYKKLKDGDKFDITLKNFGGAKYCKNANLCKNDGSEFKLSNGQFVNAKTRRDLDAAFTPETSGDDDGPGAGVPFRRFMGDDGAERLWLSNDRNGTLVGSQVWGEEDDKVATITHEIFDD